MSDFSRAIVKTPGRSLIDGLSQAGLGRPDYQLALSQHRQYTEALRICGLAVEVLAADEAFADSVFIEDVAVLTPRCAVLTRPAAPSRAGETAAMAKVLPSYFARIETIEPPATLDGGDVMQVGSHFYIGLSGRTNQAGASQLIAILERYGLSGMTVPVRQFLHLKTGITWVGDHTLLATGEMIDQPAFADFTILPVPASEAAGANCIRINDRVLLPSGCPTVHAMLVDRGEQVIEIDISEFAKLDGGLTCLSLRF